MDSSVLDEATNLSTFILKEGANQLPMRIQARSTSLGISAAGSDAR
jgi:hypothetical protein